MFDWSNPKDLDSLFNQERIDEIVANPDEPQNAEVLAIINKMPLPTEATTIELSETAWEELNEMLESEPVEKPKLQALLSEVVDED